MRLPRSQPKNNKRPERSRENNMAKSKIQNIKDGRGYTKASPKCSNCEHFSSEERPNEWGYIEDKKCKCTIGNFAVNKTAWCKIYSFK